MEASDLDMAQKYLTTAGDSAIVGDQQDEIKRL